MGLKRTSSGLLLRTCCCGCNASQCSSLTVTCAFSGTAGTGTSVYLDLEGQTHVLTKSFPTSTVWSKSWSDRNSNILQLFCSATDPNLWIVQHQTGGVACVTQWSVTHTTPCPSGVGSWVGFITTTGCSPDPGTLHPTVSTP
jgi:hypothetical protein